MTKRIPVIILAVVAGFVASLLVLLDWPDTETWLRSHDRLIDEITVWCLASGPIMLSLVKFLSFWELHGQQDQTAVGRAIKPQKLTEAFAWLAFGLLYSLTLYAYYGSVDVGFWPRIVLRFGLIVSVVFAVLYGIRFIYTLRKERVA
jgi:hypothetical protein